MNIETKPQQHNINVIVIGEEGVGKSSLINIFANEERASVSEMHTKTYKMMDYKINIGNFSLVLHDTPGIEGKYSDEEISSGIGGIHFDLIFACLDGTRIRPVGMVRKTINFISKYLPDIPVMFVITKENLLMTNEINRIIDIKSSIRGIADNKFKHYGLVSVGNKIDFNVNNNFWKEFINCIPETNCIPNTKNVIAKNFNIYDSKHNKAIMVIKEYFCNNVDEIPGVQEKRLSKNYKIKIAAIFLLLSACILNIMGSLTILISYYNNMYEIIVAVAIMIICFTMCYCICSVLLIFYYYSYYAILPIDIDNIKINNYFFTGTIYSISSNYAHTTMNGIIAHNDIVYVINDCPTQSRILAV